MAGTVIGSRKGHGRANTKSFVVNQSGAQIDFEMKSEDEQVSVRLVGSISDHLPEKSIFSSLSEASAFFESGSLGYSVTGDAKRLDGLVLETKQWHVEALDVYQVSSSYFSDKTLLPRGSVEFDHALIMRNIEHEWHGAPNLYL